MKNGERILKNLGSSLALFVGCIAILVGLLALVQNSSQQDTFRTGIVMVLGALAYRSAKKRRLGEVESTKMRISFEIILLAGICAAIFGQSNFPERMMTNAVTNVLVPTWALVAYLAACRHVAEERDEIAASARLRIMLAVAAAVMLGLWGWSLVPPIQNWGNPNEDGFSYVPLFYTTIICLPIGLLLLTGAIAGRGRFVRRARIAFVVAAGITTLVVAFLIVQHIADNNGGKVFGIQIGLRLERTALQLVAENALDNAALPSDRICLE